MEGKEGKLARRAPEYAFAITTRRTLDVTEIMFHVNKSYAIQASMVTHLHI